MQVTMILEFKLVQLQSNFICKCFLVGEGFLQVTATVPGGLCKSCIKIKNLILISVSNCNLFSISFPQHNCSSNCEKRHPSFARNEGDVDLTATGRRGNIQEMGWAIKFWNILNILIIQ